MSIRQSLSLLHVEVLIKAMQCMKTLQISEVMFRTNCSQLEKMVFLPENDLLSLHI